MESKDIALCKLNKKIDFQDKDFPKRKTPTLHKQQYSYMYTHTLNIPQLNT